MELPDLLSLVDDRRSLLEQPEEAGGDHPWAGGNCMSCVKSELVDHDHSAEKEPEQLADELLRCDEDLDWPLSPGGYDVHSAEDNCSIQGKSHNANNNANNEDEEDGEEVGDPMNNNYAANNKLTDESKNIEITSSEAKSNDASMTPKEELQKKENSLYSLRRNPKRSRRFIDQEYALDILPTSAGNSSVPISVTAAVIPVNVSAAIPVALSKKNSSSNSSIFNEKARACTECGKEFSSWKALFGHMRCHPEREWRGIQRPDNISDYKFSKSSGGGGVRRSSKKQRHAAAAPAFMLEDDQDDQELEALYIKVVQSDNESDTESIEAAYINGSCNASGGFNSSRGKIITGKRSKRSRQMSSKPSVQEFVAVATTAATAAPTGTTTSASTPAEIKEERDMARCLVMLACAGKKMSSSLGFEDEEEGDGDGDAPPEQQGEDEGTSTTNLEMMHEVKSNCDGGSGSSSEMENNMEDDEVMIVGGDFEHEEHKRNEQELNPGGGVLEAGAAAVVQVQKECPVIDESGLLCTELLDPEFDGIRMKYECST